MFSKKYKKIISIEGMHCDHCANTVKTALTSIKGVNTVKVNLSKKEAIITSNEELDNKAIEEAFKDLTFKITNIK